MTERAEAHEAAGGVAHLTLLKVEARLREQVEIAGVVIMQMGDDDVTNSVRADAKARQSLRRVELDLAVSHRGLFGIETGIDEDIAAAAADQPDEIVEIGGRRLVRVRRDEVHVG